MRLVELREERSLVWLTMSKDFDWSMAIVVVRSGFVRLKPCATWVTKSNKAVVHEWHARDPCWVGEKERELSSGKRRCSSTLTAGQRREIGR